MEEILKYTGIGGLSVALVFLVFRNIITKNIFPKLKQDYAFRTLRLIIVLISILSLACITGYFFLETRKISPNTNTSTSNSNVVTGNNNTIISGDNTSINYSNPNVPFYNSNTIDDGINDSLATFIENNDGKEVMLNLFIYDNFFLNKEERESYNFDNDFFPYRKEQFDIVELEFEEDYNNISKFIFSVHQPSDKHFYIDENDSTKKKYYYVIDQIECKVIINSINQNLLFRNKDYVTLKGKYFISYNIGNMGHNFATLEPRM